MFHDATIRPTPSPGPTYTNVNRSYDSTSQSYKPPFEDFTNTRYKTDYSRVDRDPFNAYYGNANDYGMVILKK